MIPVAGVEGWIDVATGKQPRENRAASSGARHQYFAVALDENSIREGGRRQAFGVEGAVERAIRVIALEAVVVDHHDPIAAGDRDVADAVVDGRGDVVMVL